MLEIRVGEVAKRGLITIEEDAPVISAIKLMIDRNIGSIVVTSHKRPAGIITERDILKKILVTGKSTESTRAGEIMTPDPVMIEQDRPLGEAIDLLNRKNLRKLLVTQGGEIVGVVSQRDILSLNRLCLYCGKEIKSVLEYGLAAEPYTECQCGSRYHARCANMVVHCVDCSTTLVANVIYPEPSETMSG